MIKILKLWCCLLLFAASVDVQAENKRVLVVGGDHFSPAKYHQIQPLIAKQQIVIDILTAKQLANRDVSKNLAQYDLVIFDVYNQRMAKKNFSQFKASIKKLPKLRAIALNWFANDGILQNANIEQAQGISDYISNGGAINLQRVSDYLGHWLWQKTTVLPPAAMQFPQQGIYHPDSKTIFTNLSDYLAFKPLISGRSTIGIAFNRADIERNHQQVLDRLIAGIEAKGHQVVAFYYRGFESAGLQQRLLEVNSEVVIDNIINFKSIHMASAQRVEYQKLGKPIIQVLQYRGGDQEKWEQDSMGLSPTMTPFYLTLPEGAGVIDPILISAKGDGKSAPKVIEYQLASLVNRAINLAQLAKKANRDKKVGIMIWNYPAGERNIGASFLNVPRSLARISQILADNDYQISVENDQFFITQAAKILRPFYRDYQLDQLLDNDLAALMPLSTYLTWYQKLPQTLRADIEDEWGQPDNGFMQIEHQGQTHFIIPRIRIGNLFIMRQPPRSDSLDKEKEVYHSRIVPINHNYLAAYLYLKQQVGIDALIHLGTHGSQEYLSGKERALSVYDAGTLAVGDVPVIYPFIMDDIGEAMQTKRRGRAVVIAHLTPPFAASGLQQEFGVIHDLMHAYQSMDTGQVKTATQDKIIEQCFELGMCEDIGWDRARARADFSEFKVQLHDYMSELASELQPLGLHTFGIQQDKLHTLSTIAQMLGDDFIKLAQQLELNEKTDDDIVKQPSLALSDQFGVATLSQYLIKQPKLEAPESLSEFIAQAREFYQGFSQQAESSNLIKALEGQYIAVKNGGDPVRNPAALPSGSNLYGFDPAKLPTKEAYEAGTQLLQQSIDLYRAKHQTLPDKMAFSLWSIEAMRHHGVLESQLMAAMGIRPVWDKYGYVQGTEIIEYKELGRPRIDVVVSATSLYRDAFPNVMLLLADAIDKIARLKEPYNHLYANTQKVKSDLAKQGMDDDDADKLSTMRIFSNESGNYGSGLDGSTMKSGSWEQDDKLADLYLDRMGYAYGKDVADWGIKAPAGVKLYDRMLSGTDVAVLSRSSNVYGMLSSDDPFEYLGGISLAVRNIDGKSPELMIANLRNPKGIKVESAQRFLGRELKTRSLHRRWVKEMQDEGYAGAIAMLSRINNFWGWQVMDPNIVTDQQWQQLFEVYVEDKLDLEINEWFEQVHPTAQAQLIERMLESIRKDYWQADEQVTEKLVERYIELANKYDVISDNEKFNQFTTDAALGFGLAAALPTTMQPLAAQPQATATAATTESVEGMKLEQQSSDSEAEPNYQYYWLMLLAFIIFGGGFMVGIGRKNNLVK